MERDADPIVQARLHQDRLRRAAATEEKGVGSTPVSTPRALESGDVASSSNSNFRVEGFRGEARERGASGELETEAAARASPKRRVAEARGQKRLPEDPDDESRVLDEGERFAQDAGSPAPVADAGSPAREPHTVALGVSAGSSALEAGAGSPARPLEVRAGSPALEVGAGSPALGVGHIDEDVGAVRVGSGAVDGGGDAADANMDALPLFAAGPVADEEPDDPEDWEDVYDLEGNWLDPELVKAGRMEEIAWIMKQNLF
eukprot:6473879-Amphidinium_carterae.1